MNTSDIRKALANDPKASLYFIDVFSYDQMVRNVTGENDALYVFNTKPSLLPGEHWMAMAVRDGEGFYFDSFGRHPAVYPALSRKLQTLFRTIHWNKVAFQNPSTTACGDYCILFGLLFSRGWTLQMFVNWLSSFTNSEIRDHTIRGIVIDKYGTAFHSSYRDGRRGLSGFQQLHVDRIAKTVSGGCLF